jgi:hypothetical protein
MPQIQLTFPSPAPLRIALLQIYRGARRWAQGGVAMKWHCKECGRFSLRLNKEEECPECARKEQELKSYFTKLFFINEGCARLVPAA